MVGKLIKLRTREVKGYLFYSRNSNFADCILTGVQCILFSVNYLTPKQLGPIVQ